MSDERISAREAARRRMPLDGADAQALENALTITERERDEAQADNTTLRARVAKLERNLALADADRVNLLDANAYLQRMADAHRPCEGMVKMEGEVARMREVYEAAVAMVEKAHVRGGLPLSQNYSVPAVEFRALRAAVEKTEEGK